MLIILTLHVSLRKRTPSQSWRWNLPFCYVFIDKIKDNLSIITQSFHLSFILQLARYRQWHHRLKMHIKVDCESSLSLFDLWHMHVARGLAATKGFSPPRGKEEKSPGNEIARVITTAHSVRNIKDVTVSSVYYNCTANTIPTANNALVP